jgi:hypothetical protein
MAGLTPQDGIFGNKASPNNGKSDIHQSTGTCPLCHNGAPKESGKTQNDKTASALKSKDATAVNLEGDSQTS